ncbi:hypothetical protein GUJ93_ZPchr0004g38520 [Zizania palustris]|uniref:Uncharacterized protein n=1 Tax=Zizania palustris TaxID=103762 RepID=A0A8J5SM51_ZIZPA|nr:hypothetical protein GUJ93_ZPchr0004g38520 [Zizania palustris]
MRDVIPSGKFGREDDSGICFYLVDIWNHFYQWSACGISIPIRLPCGEKIEQCFVPHLSAIQLYTNDDSVLRKKPTGPADNKILFGNLYDGNCTWFSAADNWNGQNAASSNIDDTLSSKKIGDPCFEYFDCELPCDRMPLTDKVYELYFDFPPLTSLNSQELSPSSWMSVLWYPIGHVPVTTHKDLTTCFLTYYSLSTFEDRTPLHSKAALTLKPFGLVTNKTGEEDIWASKDSGDQELATSLMDAADSWLKKLDVTHHDFNSMLNGDIDMKFTAEGSESASPV